MQDLYSYGPVAVSLLASQDLLYYSSGVYSGIQCEKGEIFSQPLLLVGYGTDE